MNNELTIEKNKQVLITGLYQWRTYGGLIDGIPHNKMNDRILKELPNRAKKLCTDIPVYIIEPKQTPIPYDGKYPFGVPMSMPSVICVAELSSGQPVRDMDMHGSQLIVAWFQDQYALPIDHAILDKIKEIHWSKFAEDFCY
ncbi:MAG: hypothetical protein JST26_04610 [Bacteroidetes bacterium]|nr:hypothetical protein [Bacteroidota bacterium]